MDQQPPSSSLSAVIEQNIEKLVRLDAESRKHRSLQDRIADLVTAFSGRMVFVYVHIVWFAAWIIVNTGRVGIAPFDPFPYGFLTMVVSLEAIFLSTFVLISQNRMGEAADRRAELDLHIGLLTEHEVTRVLQMLDAIQTKLEIVDDDLSDLAQLELETKPEDVLAEIARLHHQARS